MFNGELYNHLEVSNGLPSPAWLSHSDSETLVNFQAQRGPALLLYLPCMFARRLRPPRAAVAARPRWHRHQPPLFGLAGASCRGWGALLIRSATHARCLLRDQLDRAVSEQLLGDGPVDCLLSSSLVFAILLALTCRIQSGRIGQHRL